MAFVRDWFVYRVAQLFGFRVFGLIYLDNENYCLNYIRGDLGWGPGLPGFCVFVSVVIIAY